MAGALAALSLLLEAAGSALQYASGSWSDGFLLGLPLIGVGWLLATRRPRNPIGWLFLVGGLSGAWLTAANAYGPAGVGSLPGAAHIGALGVLGFYGLVAAVVLAVLHLPNGRLRSPRWRLAVVATVASAVLMNIQEILGPWDREHYGANTNPLHLPALDGVTGVLGDLGALVFLGVMVAAVAQIVLRFRGSTGVERQQLKWIVSGCVAAFIVSASGPILTPLLPPLQQVPWWSNGLALTIIPVAVAVAVLRYRLYEVDRIVSRTATYLVLTAGLVAIYALAAVSLGALVRATTGGGGGDLAVAGSTLVVAALFRPLRTRIQGVVDRRFNRARYDAQETMERLSARVRDAIALGSLGEDLERTARESLQPQHVSLWLAPSGRRP
jgi:hypothetical protein